LGKAFKSSQRFHTNLDYAEEQYANFKVSVRKGRRNKLILKKEMLILVVDPIPKHIPKFFTKQIL